MRLADTWLAEQQHRRQLDRIVGVDAQREMLADVFQHLAEVGQLLEQALHLGKRRRFYGEALEAEAQHLLVYGAQRFVRRARQLLQRLLDTGKGVDVLESGDRDAHGCRHASPLLAACCAQKSSMTAEPKQTMRQRWQRWPASANRLQWSYVLYN